MKDYSIKVLDVGKVYKLYQKPVDRFKEVLNPFKKIYHEDFYALNGINFTVKKGETLGIIGKNGSGKSTLLKIITGVLTQSTGDVEVNGKISALLELGAGFNGEMTGIENIYLNGTMLGYTKNEIEKSLDSILEFADIGNFVYQPVKTYSSGMFVRLAFALAINIDPDILIVDEALSVGDMKFQQKCYRKIREFKKSGTVLFVSHDTGAIANFCDRVIWLNDGKIYKEGKPNEILDDYQAYMSYDIQEMDMIVNYSEEADNKETKARAFGNKKALFSKIFLTNENNDEVFSIIGETKININMKISIYENIEMPLLGFTLKDSLGNSLIITNTYFENIKLSPFQKDDIAIYQWSFTLPKLRNGKYSFDVALANGTYHAHEQVQWINDALVITVKNNELYQEGRGLLIIKDVELKSI